MLVQITPQLTINLHHPPEFDSNPFLILFSDVWQEVLDIDKVPMLALWVVGFAGEPAPVIGLGTMIEIPGKTENGGMILGFHSSVLDGMSELFVKQLIAHERGHVRKYADPNSFANTQPNNNQAKEDEADAVAESWGFNMVEMRTTANEAIDDMIEWGINVQHGQQW